MKSMRCYSCKRTKPISEYCSKGTRHSKCRACIYALQNAPIKKEWLSFKKIRRICIGIHCRGEKIQWIRQGEFTCLNCQQTVRGMTSPYGEQIIVRIK